MDQNKTVKCIFIIVNAGHADEIVEITRGEGAGGATILNARGSGDKHEVFMGITIDIEKEIILCLADDTTADKIINAVKAKAGINTTAHGVCFTLPVDKMIGMRISPNENPD